MMSYVETLQQPFSPERRSIYAKDDDDDEDCYEADDITCVTGLTEATPKMSNCQYPKVCKKMDPEEVKRATENVGQYLRSARQVGVKWYWLLGHVENLLGDNERLQSEARSWIDKSISPHRNLQTDFERFLGDARVLQDFTAAHFSGKSVADCFFIDTNAEAFDLKLAEPVSPAEHSPPAIEAAVAASAARAQDEDLSDVGPDSLGYSSLTGEQLTTNFPPDHLHPDDGTEILSGPAILPTNSNEDDGLLVSFPVRMSDAAAGDNLSTAPATGQKTQQPSQPSASGVVAVSDDDAAVRLLERPATPWWQRLHYCCRPP